MLSGVHPGESILPGPWAQVEEALAAALRRLEILVEEARDDDLRPGRRRLS
ncbi:MAG: hypothetical protein Q9Q40_07605 [Acidobacteriota bacterium]|nr:hypothetical protein [Acidobacteriota bacterium]MDQ7088357.1 hypothetical protein [Acidobacteriota bacterium]